MISIPNLNIRAIALFIFFPLFLFGQEPQGYYDEAEGKSGEELRTALYDIIKGHTSVSYASLWEHFYDTDRKSNGYVWDMYSDIPGGQPAYDYEFFQDQCGSYSGEGSCYNREHSFPKSWFGNQSPMSTDMFHLYPVDGYTNGRRSNYPYGESDGTIWVSTNGSRLGYSTYPGYTGKVFEPIDEYKGDFARTYFYMITRYKNKVSGWSSPMLSGSGFTEWALDLLLEWNAQDPVSEKEINRNNAIYNIQNNRNPFIDRPEFVIEIWGDPVSVPEFDKPSVTVRYTGYSVTIDAPSGDYESLVIFNTMGQVVGEYNIQNKSAEINRELNNGIYIARLKKGTNVLAVKFIVSH